MTGRYAAFTFVDRIVALEAGLMARGTFHIPASAGDFPAALLGEATGQLAAWVAVDKLGYRVRPVAGIARESIYHGVARPGDTLETEIRIDSCEDDAVAYQGSCRIGGRTVLELCDCVGPMLPLEDFDDAQAMRSFFGVLCTTGAPLDRFPGIVVLPLRAVTHMDAHRASAHLDVPAHAPFFADHFPRRPVFPGTLLLDRMTALPAGMAREALGNRAARVRRVSDIKLRAFIEPGTQLTLQAALAPVAGHSVTATVEARVVGQARLVGSARIEFEVAD